MKNEITLTNFILLIVEVFVFIFLVSRGGGTIYQPKEEGFETEVADEITIRPDRYIATEDTLTTDEEYWELPFWYREMSGAVKKYSGHLDSELTGVRKAVLMFKGFVLFVITAWISFLLIANLTYKKQNSEIKVLMVVKLVLIFFFMFSGFLSVIGNMKPHLFWNYGNLTSLPTIKTYISVKNVPMLLALIMGVFSLIRIKFLKKPSPPPAPKKEHKVTH